MKNIWILNHHATGMFESRKGRHFHFAQNLNEMGYNTTIFCASFKHKSDENYINDRKDYIIKYADGVRFVFVRVNKYTGSGLARIRAMLQYTSLLFKIYKKMYLECGKPDVIIGSSVHPLACYAALRISKKIGCRNILEFRDLWPETLVMMGYVKEKSILAFLLYKGEKMLYKKADRIIFTMEGGYQYIIDQGWEHEIDKKKVYHINNGIDLALFREKAERGSLDKNLNNSKFKVIYTGTIAPANGCRRIVEAGMALQRTGYDDIEILLYGDGEERKELEEYCRVHDIRNVKFKGQVCFSDIPGILGKANLLLVNYTEDTIRSAHSVFRYGASHNKLFEYMAAGKPILYAQPCNYNLVASYGCGIVLGDVGQPQSIEEGILKIKNLNRKDYEQLCMKSKEAAENYDFHILTVKLVNVIESNI